MTKSDRHHFDSSQIYIDIATCASSSSSAAPPRQPTLPTVRYPRQGPTANNTTAQSARGTKLSSAELSFDSVWFGVRKAAKNGRQNDLDSFADVLRLTNTRRARSAQHDVGGRLPGWVNKFKWQEGRDWVKVVPEFRARTGGGNGGVGLVQSAAQQIYTWCQP